MDNMARELIAPNNCGVDYQNDNPQVLQAYNGLIAYEPLYQASCLRDDEGSFCKLSLKYLFRFPPTNLDRLCQRCHQRVRYYRFVSLLPPTWCDTSRRRAPDL
jgi:hypothetical protein